MKIKVYLGGDHRGYELKGKVAQWLFELEYDFEDLGADFLDPNDDYTTYAERVASLVANNKNSKGILLCGSGVGIDVVANKFDGIRSSIGKNPEQVKAGRNDDDMNILVLASDFTEEKEAKEMVKIFLETEFSKKERYERRLGEVKKIEENN